MGAKQSYAKDWSAVMCIEALLVLTNILQPPPCTKSDRPDKATIPISARTRAVRAWSYGYILYIEFEEPEWFADGPMELSGGGSVALLF